MLSHNCREQAEALVTGAHSVQLAGREGRHRAWSGLGLAIATRNDAMPAEYGEHDRHFAHMRRHLLPWLEAKDHQPYRRGVVHRGRRGTRCILRHRIAGGGVSVEQLHADAVIARSSASTSARSST